MAIEIEPAAERIMLKIMSKLSENKKKEKKPIVSYYEHKEKNKKYNKIINNSPMSHKPLTTS